ncbi:MAG: endo-1,4-beta-xylanase [Pirellulales bacterium]|nr:endo-1,4-beta-xylanase [Pirellulales bacterium]
MKNVSVFRVWTTSCLIGVLMLAAGRSSMLRAQTSEADLLATADKRIKKHRMSDATIVVVDAAGQPVPGAKVVVEQTRHAFLFGSNIFQWGKLPDEKMEAAYRDHFAELLNFATLPFYWTSYERERGKPIHEHTEQVARWCREHGITTKGHPLAWNMGDPAWLPDDLEEIRRLQMARIDDCVSRFVGLIDRWDVVNEATHYDRPDFVNRRAPKHSAMWKQVGQIEFTRECFTHARRAGPKATLLINDYRTDPAYEKVIKQLVDDKGRRLYDVIGIQSHMHGGVWPTAKIWEVCERFSRFGVPLHFTETTVISGERGWDRPGPWDSTAKGEVYQAREAVRFYTMLFSHPAVEAITWWDFSDYHAWQGAPAGFLRKDMTPKPMYHELKKLIKGKWWTQATLETGSDGTAGFRGFCGDYRITVTLGEKKTRDEFSLVRGQQGTRKVTLD